jgi:hypothetical protein
MTCTRDIAVADGAVLRAMSEGDPTTTEGAAAMGLMSIFRRTQEITQLEARVAALVRQWKLTK